MSRFDELIKNRTLLCDGAMGTMLQDAGLVPGQCPELLNVDSPETVKTVHRAYIGVGADIIETNSFGGSRVKLSSYGLQDRTVELNAAAVKVAREAASDKTLVAGSVGPTGRFLHPVGDLDFDEAVDIFAEQVGALASAGADLILLETFSDIKEIRAAVIGAREVTDIPVAALMTFEPSSLTLLGSTPEAAAITLEAAGADAVGSNCGLGPDGILEVLRRMAAVTELPLVAMPNAGMPRLENGQTVFPASPDEMAQPFEEFLGIGTAILGGCCGTSPAHIARMRQELDQSGPRSDRVLTDRVATRLSSRGSALFVGGNSPVRAIGERLNPTGRKSLAQSVRDGLYDPYRDEASRQVEAGAQMLDVNVGVPGIDEENAMAEAIHAVGQAVSVPLVIDSPRPEVVEAGLKAADGKALINSVTGEIESLEKVLPLAKKYGAAVLGLTLDEKGIPDTAQERLAIAQRILTAAREIGIPDQDVLIDCLTLSAGAEQERVDETLKTVSLVKEQLGLNTLLGVSNISYGLPSRVFLNAAFLSMAARAGLSAAIINPFDETSMGILAAARVILNQDHQAAAYISLHRGRSGADEPAGSMEEEKDDENIEASLGRAVVSGHPEKARELAVALLDQGLAPMEIGEKVLIPAMGEVGEKFARNEYFLPQVLMSAKAMQSAFEPIREAMKGQDIPSAGKILMATVEGDIHDIGKNIVITLLENHGFEVLDLGKNIPADELVKQASQPGIDAVGLSALMTTTMVHMENAIRTMKDNGLKVPIVVGGAAVTPEYAVEIGADGYAEDATQAIKVFLELLKGKR